MRRVELHTAQRVKPGHEHGYCVRDGLGRGTVDFGGGYARLASKARRLSRHIGEEVVDGIRYSETHSSQKGLAAVYIQTSEYCDGVLEVERFDYFEHGHYARTVKYEYLEGGKVSRTEYTNEQQ